MDPITQYNAATQIDKAEEPSVASIFSDAVNVTPAPLQEGFDDLFVTNQANVPPGASSPIIFTNNDQDFNPIQAFSITVNGSTSSTGVQQSPISLDCADGKGFYPPLDSSSSTSAQEVDFSTGGSLSVDPPLSGVTYYRVLAKVSAFITENGTADLNPTGTIDIEEVGAIGVLPAGSNTRFRRTGLSSYEFLIYIGNVALQRTSDGRYAVKITQIQEGDYSYGNISGGTATAGGQTVDLKDGVRRFTVCINGEAFTCDIDISNLTKVT